MNPSPELIYRQAKTTWEGWKDKFAVSKWNTLRIGSYGGIWNIGE
jgi:hypothetical protein